MITQPIKNFAVFFKIYHIYKSLQFSLILSQLHLFPNLKPCLFKICINIIPQYIPKYLTWSCPLTFSDRILYAFLFPHACYMPACHILLHLIDLTVLCEGYRTVSVFSFTAFFPNFTDGL